MKTKKIMLELFDIITILCCFMTLGTSLSSFATFVNSNFTLVNIFLHSLIISEKISVQKRAIMRYFYLRKFNSGHNSSNCGKPPTRLRSRLPRSIRSASCPANYSTSNIDNQAIDVDQSMFEQHE